MHIALVYNKKIKNTEQQAEWLSQEDVRNFKNGLQKLGHKVTAIPVSSIYALIDRLKESKPDLIFNTAMGSMNPDREGIFPAVYTFLNIPFTGGNARVLLSSLNKRLVEKILSEHNVPVPKGCVIENPSQPLTEDLQYPLMIKPNYEGSGMGIHSSSIAENKQAYEQIIAQMLKDYPQGINVEEYIQGREITVPMLEAWPEKILEIVEYQFKENNKYNIYDYEHKQHGLKTGTVEAICPPKLSEQERDRIIAVARKIFSVISCSDMGRIDFRLNKKGIPYFIEINPIPRIQPDASLIIAAKARGLTYEEVLKLIIQSAANRHQLYMSSDVKAEYDKTQRVPCREHGISIGRFNTGKYNAITGLLKSKAKI